MEETLKKTTQLNYFGQGSIVKAILSVVNEKLEEYYSQLDFNSTMAFVSRSQGAFLDLLGELLDCHRTINEDDEDYRYRIAHQVYSVAGANETAVRLACLSVDNVKDVRLVPYVKGAGSFVVYINVEDRSLLDQTISNVQSAIDESKGHGIKGEVVVPVFIPVDIKVKLTLDVEYVNQATRESVQQAVADYIDNLDVSESLIIAHVFHRILENNPTIRNAEIQNLIINDRPVLVSDRNARWNEQFVPGKINIS